MNNYIIEGGIDFYQELNNVNNNVNNLHDVNNLYDVNNVNNNICLITKEQLSYNYITLPCNHSFNYVPLYKEICLQKQKITYLTDLEIVKLSSHQIKCPYCRTIINNLIPYIPINDEIQKIINVNSPSKYCMTRYKCRYTFKSGKTKGSLCNKHAYEIPNKDGIYCEKHWNSNSNKNKNKNKKENMVWTEEMEKIFKNNKVKQLKLLLNEKGYKLTGTKKELVYRLLN